MKKVILIKLSDDVKDASGFLCSFNKDKEVYLNLDQLSQFSFDKNEIRYMLSGFDIDGCFVLVFSSNGMGEFHRIKREIEEYMGIEHDKVNS